MTKRFKMLLLGFVLLVCLSSINVFAFNTFNGNILEGGVGDWGAARRYYWIDSSAATFTSIIDQAMSEWIYTTDVPGVSTPISFRKTTYRPESSIDLFYGVFYDYPSTILAETRFFRYSTEVSPMLTDWRWTTIELNKPRFDDLPTNSYGNHKLGTIAHEMGHAMGLNHNYDIYTIMCPYSGLGEGNERRVTRAQVDDLNGINYLYP